MVGGRDGVERSGFLGLVVLAQEGEWGHRSRETSKRVGKGRIFCVKGTEHTDSVGTTDIRVEFK